MFGLKSILVLAINCIPLYLFGQMSAQDSLKIQSTIYGIENEQFVLGTKRSDIPRNILRKLSKIDNEKFRIANSDADFNSGDALQKRSLPNKRIIYIAHNSNFYVITYEQGGFGKNYYSRIVKYEKRKIKCLVTFIMPPHSNIEEFKNIMKYKRFETFVLSKSIYSN